jgi:Tfp pilus assembly protein PilF
LGTAYGRAGEMSQALSCYEKCIKIKQDSHEVYFNVGRVYDELKNHEKAIQNYTHAIKLNNDYKEAWNAQGVTFFNLKIYEESLKNFDYAIQISSSYAEAWFNRGNALRCLRKYSEALESYDEAIKINSNYIDPWLNKGAILKDQKKFNEAIFCFQKCLEFKHDLGEAHFNIGLIELLMGNFERGWNQYEYRWLKFGAESRFTKINWLETLNNIAGKKILVWHEQGFGDTIQFSRFVNELIKLNADVTFEVQDKLKSFFDGQIKCSVKSNIIDGDYDFQIPLLSLPRLFKVTSQNIPPPIKSFLNIQNSTNRKIKPKIGVAFSGNPKHENDHNRSIPMFQMEKLLGFGDYYLIQKELLEEDKFLLKQMGISCLDSKIQDFRDTASIVSEMDLIISVDTSLIHLAGTLGKKSLLLLPWVPDWRWMLNESYTPWYPTVNLIRQERLGDWEPVLNEVRQYLETKL